MSFGALWMDHQHAKLFTFTKEKGTLDMIDIDEEDIEADKSIEHHNRHPHDMNNDVKELQLTSYFHKIIEKLGHLDQLMLMGPGLAKTQFKHHCEAHNHKDVSKAIVGLETMGSHPSKSDMIDKAQKFFDQSVKEH